jgi:ADP-ribose pyrophosphatase YjhB (NUDIX family)
MGILDGWKFCPRCAAATVAGDDHVRCPACDFVAWANSVPAVQALVERDGRLLLVRRALDPGRGKWDLPGGFLQEGEHPLDGLARELEEETALDVELGEFVGAWLDPYDGRTVLGLTWAGRARPGDDARPTTSRSSGGSHPTSFRPTPSSRSPHTRASSRSGGTSTRSARGSTSTRTGGSSTSGSPSAAARTCAESIAISNRSPLRVLQAFGSSPSAA